MKGFVGSVQNLRPTKCLYLLNKHFSSKDTENAENDHVHGKYRFMADLLLYLFGFSNFAHV